MRDYLSTANLGKAAGLAMLVTLMSVGRLIQGGIPWFSLSRSPSAP